MVTTHEDATAIDREIAARRKVQPLQGREAIPVRPPVVVVSPNGRVTAQRSRKEILEDVKEQREQFSVLAERWGCGNDEHRAELRMAMQPIVKQENALRREFVAAPPAQQLTFSFGR